MNDFTRIDELAQRQLDGELDGTERAELSALVASDPAAGRRLDEYVALEGLLFAVGSTDRPHEPTVDPVLSTLGADAVPSEEELALAGSWIPSVVGAIVLAALILWGIPSSPPIDAPPTNHELAAANPLEVARISEGLVALPGVSENPDIQIVMIHQWQPAERNER